MIIGPGHDVSAVVRGGIHQVVLKGTESVFGAHMSTRVRDTSRLWLAASVGVLSNRLVGSRP